MGLTGANFYSDELKHDDIQALLRDRVLTANEIVEGLWHGQVRVRRNAARGASLIGPLPSPGDAMLAIAARDADDDVRAAIVGAVARRTGVHRVALPILFDALFDRADGIADIALEGLEDRLANFTREVIGYFIEALRDVRPLVVSVAVQLLIKVGPVDALPRIVALLGDEDARVRRAAYDVLERLKWKAAPLLIDALRDPLPRPLAAKLLSGLGEVTDAARRALDGMWAEADVAGDVAFRATVEKVLTEISRVVEPLRTKPLDIPIPGFELRELELSALDGQTPGLELSEIFYALRDGRAHVRRNAAALIGRFEAALEAEPAVLAKLAPVVKDGDAGVKRAAARTLAAFSPTGAARLLVVALGDTQAEVREEAVESFRRLGSEALAEALEVLSIETSDVARAGILMVASRLGQSAVPVLADALAGAAGTSAVAREVAARALGSIGKAAEDGLSALVGALQDPLESVRGAAAEALGFVGIEDETILSGLKRLLRDPLPQVRRTAALSAARITGRPLDDRSASEPLQVPIPGFETQILDRDQLAETAGKVSLAVLVKALRDGRERVRRNAATAIGLFGARGGSAAQPLAVLLRDGDVEVRRTAVEAFRGLDKAALPAVWFLTAALGDPDARVKEGVIELLAGLHPEAEDFLIEALRADTGAARAGIFNVWYQLGHAGVPGLVRALANGSGLIRVNACWALEMLAKRGGDAAADALELKLSDPISQVRGAAQAALDAIRGDKVPPARVLEPDPVPVPGFDARILGADALAPYAADIGAERFVRALRDGRPWVRANATTALGLLGADGLKAVGPLGLAARDSSVDVRRAAYVALGQLAKREGATDEARRAHAVLVTGLEDRTQGPRDAARTALQAVGAAGLPALIEGLARPAEVAAHTVVPLIASLGARSVDALKQALTSDWSPLRAGALRAFRKLDRELLKGVRADVEKLKQDTDDAVKAEVQPTLDRIDGRDEAPVAIEPLPLPAELVAGLVPKEDIARVTRKVDVNVLLRAANDGREVVRANAARALGATRNPPKRVAWVLALLLRDGEAEVRKAAVDALEMLGAEAAAPAAFWLAMALGEAEESVKDQIVNVLAGIHGETPLALVEAMRCDAEVARETILLVFHRIGGPSVPTLIGALKHGSGLVRINAAQGLELLAKRGADAAVGELEAALADPIGQVRVHAALAIDAIKGGRPRPVKVLEPDPVAIPGFDDRMLDTETLRAGAGDTSLGRMLRAFRDGRPWVRANAARLVPAYGGEALGALAGLGVLTRDDTIEVRRGAAEALGTLVREASGETRDETLAMLVAQLEDKAEVVRKAAAAALGALGAEALAALIDGLERPAEVADKTVVPLITALGRDAVAGLKTALAVDWSPLRAGSLRALRKLDRELVKPLRADIEKLKLVTDDAVKAEVQATLDRIDGRDEAPVVIEPLALPAELVEGLVARDAIAAVARRLDAAVLLRAANDGREVVRANAARALGALPNAPKRAAWVLALLLRDANDEVRRAAVDGLEALGAETAAPAAFWLAIALSEPDAALKDQIVNVLSGIHAVAPKALVEAMRTDSDVARETILLVFHRIGGPAVPTLIGALKHASGLVRINAAQGLELLAKRGADAALEALEAALADPIGQVRVHAALAIDAIKGGRPRPVKVLEPDPVAIPGFDDGILEGETLRAHAGDTSLERMLRAFRDGRPWVRANAARLVSAYGVEGLGALAGLGILTRDSTIEVRRSAAEALGTLVREAGGAIGAEAEKDALGMLVTQLEDKSDVVKKAAHGALAALRDRALPALLEGLERPAEVSAKTVTPLIAALGANAVAALEQALTVDWSPLRAGALRALRKLDRELVKPLRAAVEKLKADTDDAVKAEVQPTLDRIDGKDDAPVVIEPLPLPRALVSGLLTKDAIQSAARELDVGILLRAANDGREVVRANAARALGAVPNAPKRVAWVLALLLRDADGEVRRAAVDALEGLGPEVAAPAAFWLALALDESDQALKDQIVNVLAGIHAETPNALIEAMRADPEIARETVLLVFHRIGGPAVPTLMTALNHASGLVRINAAQGLELLAKRGADAALEVLEAALADPIGQVRVHAAAAIDAITGGRPRPPKVLEADPVAIAGFDDSLVDGEFLRAHASDTSLERMLRAFRDGRPWVRANAARLVPAYGTEGLSALAGLGILARDGTIEVRRSAAEALGTLVREAGSGLGAPARGEALEMLVVLLEDKSEIVKKAAGAALQALGEGALPALIDGLERPAEVAEKAVMPLIVGLGQKAVGALKHALAVDWSPLRAGSLRAIRRLDRELVKSLRADVEKLKTDTDDAVKAEVQATLDRIDGKDEAPVVIEPLPLPAALVAGLVSREDIASVAGKLDVAILLRAANDGREFVRANAARALGSVANPPKRVAWVLALLLRDSELEVRRAAVDALAGLGAELAAPAAFWLALALDESDAALKDQIVNVLAEIHAATPNALIEAMRIDPDLARETILLVFDRVGSRSVPTLMIALKHASGLVRINAAQGLELLAKRGGDAALEVLEAALGDAIGKVRVHAALAIDAIKGGRPKPLKVLEPDPVAIADFHDTALSTETLRAEAGATTLERMVRAFRDGRPWVRANAARLLPAYGAEALGALASLGVLTRDEAIEVRRAAAEALGTLVSEVSDIADEPRAGALEMLVVQLEDKSELVRNAAADGLKALGVGALPALVEGLERSPEVLEKTVLPLIVGLGSNALGALQNALGTEWSPLRVGVLRALRKFDRELVKPLRGDVEKLKSDSDDMVRAETVATLERIDGRDEVPVVIEALALPPALVDGLVPRDAIARVARGLDEAVLLRAANDGREVVRANAARALGALKKPPKRAAWVLALLLRDSDSEVRRAAVDALEMLGAAAAAPAAFWLALALGETDAALKDQIVNVLAGIHAEAPKALVEAMRADAEVARETILLVFHRIGGKAVPTLIEALRHPSGLVRINAAQGLELLAKRGADAALEALEAALGDNVGQVRVRAAIAIDEIKGGRPRPPKVIEPDPVAIAGFDDRVLDSETLRRGARKTSLERMLRAFRDGRPWVRANAARLVPALGGEAVAAMPAVGVLARDGMIEVRRAAAEALGALVKEASAEAKQDGLAMLVRLLEDKAESVRKTAASGLAALGEEALPALTEGLERPFEVAQKAVLPLIVALGPKALGALGTALGNESPLVRAGALRALRALDRELVERLKASVAQAETDSDDQIRAEAKATLAFIDKRDVQPVALEPLPLPAAFVAGPLDARGVTSAARLEASLLLKALQDGREIVRANAARALGQSGGLEHPDRVAVRIALLLRDADPGVREAAVAGLEGLGAAIAPAAYWLAVGLGDPDPVLRERIVGLYASIYEHAPKALVEGLRCDPEVAPQTILPVCVQLAGRCVPTLIEALRNPSGLIRINAAQGLEALARKGADAAIEALEAALADPIGKVRVQAALALDAIKGGRPRPPKVLEVDPVGIPGFEDQQLDDKKLQKASKVTTVDRLARALRDGRPWVRTNAATALGLWGSDARDALASLAVAAKDESLETRKAALMALAKLGVPRRAAPIIATALSDRLPAARKAAEEALGALGADASEALGRALGTLGAELVARHLVPLYQRLGDAGPDLLAAQLAAGSPERHAGALAVLRMAYARDALAPYRGRVESLARALDAATKDAALALLDRIDGKDEAPLVAEPTPLPLPTFAERLLSRDELARDAAELRFDLLIAALRDGRDIVRANAATGLEVLGAAQLASVPYLARALRDQALEVRVRAAEALEVLPPRRDVGFDLVLVLEDASPRVVGAAEKALRAYGEFAIDAFLFGMDEVRDLVGRSILPMLASLGEKALDAFVLAQKYPSALVRQNALIGMRLLERELAATARPAVTLARNDDARDVRLEARRTLDWIDRATSNSIYREPLPLPSEAFATQSLNAKELKAQLGDTAAAVLGSFLTDGRRFVRENAARAHEVQKKFHPHLTIAMKDEYGEVRLAAAQALLALGQKALPAASNLVDALTDVDEDVRKTAHDALFGLGAKAMPAFVAGMRVPPEVFRETILPLVDRLGETATPAMITALDHPSGLVQLNSLAALTILAERGAKAAYDKVVSKTRTPLPAMIRAAQRCLFRLEGRTPAEFRKEAVPMPVPGFDTARLPGDVLKPAAPGIDRAFLHSSLFDGRILVRENTARTIGFLGKDGRALVPQLVIALKDQAPDVQVAAAEALGTLLLEDAVAIPALTFILRNARETVRRACLVSLDRFGPARVAPVLMKHLVGLEEWMVATVGRVAHRMSEALVPALAKVAANPEESLIARENAVRVLTDLGIKARPSEQTLVKLLENMDGMLAVKSAFALSRVGTPGPDLVAQLQARLNKEPRASAQAALKEAMKIVRRKR